VHHKMYSASEREIKWAVAASACVQPREEGESKSGETSGAESGPDLRQTEARARVRAPHDHVVRSRLSHRPCRGAGWVSIILPQP
jgi:hypothetical protein